MEIERKFLIKDNYFDLTRYNFQEIQQAYISTSPVIRVRKKNIYVAGSEIPSKEEYILTVKSKGMLSRQEFELELTEEDYNNLLSKSEGNIITKRRFLIPLDNNLTLELDYFKGLFQGLIMGEIEFSHEDEAKKYNLPDFISKEVTFDKRFHNSNMSLMPKEDVSELLSLLH